MRVIIYFSKEQKVSFELLISLVGLEDRILINMYILIIYILLLI